MNDFLKKLQDILASFLGQPKRDVTENGQLQFGCPHCANTYGERELSKYNLEVNIRKGRFNCWKCSSVHDEMHGSVLRLIKMYGSESLLKEYKDTVSEFKKSKLYELHFDKNDFNVDDNVFIDTSLKLPDIYSKFDPNKYNPKKALDYLANRGIGWDIINEFQIGYTNYNEKEKQLSTRIILPSYNKYGEVNYWTGRDFSGLEHRQKYFNPQVERKDIIFNENKVQWDADITLVEGPFDHIVVPNSIPLLGKSIKQDFLIYQKLMQNANANINIFLDGDAYMDVLKIYKLLNQGRMHDKIRYIPVDESLDPSEIYKQYGTKGIVDHLKNAQKISDIYLV